jgi:hypothetical protein
MKKIPVRGKWQKTIIEIDLELADDDDTGEVAAARSACLAGGLVSIEIGDTDLWFRMFTDCANAHDDLRCEDDWRKLRDAATALASMVLRVTP